MRLNEMACPCGSNRGFTQCCEAFIQGNAAPERAEQLMRSRFTAYAIGEIDYLRDSLLPREQKTFDYAAVAAWAAANHWTRLEIHHCDKGEAGDLRGYVLFTAHYLSMGQLHAHRELSLFRKKSGRWYYVKALEERP